MTSLRVAADGAVRGQARQEAMTDSRSTALYSLPRCFSNYVNDNRPGRLSSSKLALALALRGW